MKTGTWYVAGFVIAFVYFYVYAVNYVRGDPLPDHGRQWSPRNGGGGVQDSIQGTVKQIIALGKVALNVHGKKERKTFFWSAQVIPGRAPSSSNTNLGQQPLSDLPIPWTFKTKLLQINNVLSPEETVFASDIASKL